MHECKCKRRIMVTFRDSNIASYEGWFESAVLKCRLFLCVALSCWCVWDNHVILLWTLDVCVFVSAFVTLCSVLCLGLFAVMNACINAVERSKHYEWLCFPVLKICLSLIHVTTLLWWDGGSGVNLNVMNLCFICSLFHVQSSRRSSFVFLGLLTEERKLFVESSLVMRRPHSPSAADKDSN